MHKLRKLLLAVLCVFVLAISLAACSDAGGLLNSVDEPESPVIVGEQAERGEQEIDATSDVDSSVDDNADSTAAKPQTANGSNSSASANGANGVNGTSKSGGSGSSGSAGSPGSGSSGSAKSPAAQSKKPAVETITVKLSISCAQAVDVGNEIAKKVSNDGAMFSGSIKLKTGANVLDALKATKLILGLNTTPMGIYVKSINSLKEGIDGYASSGWTYYINGKFVTKSCDLYKLKAGDSIKWVYSLTSNNL